MLIETVLLAESFELDDLARLTIHNIYDIVHLPVIPTIFGPFEIFMRLKLQPGEKFGPLEIYISQDQGSRQRGRRWKDIDTIFLDLTGMDEEAGSANVGVTIGGIPIEKEGFTTLRFSTGDRLYKDLTFRVNRVQGEKSGPTVVQRGL